MKSGFLSASAELAELRKVKCRPLPWKIWWKWPKTLCCPSTTFAQKRAYRHYQNVSIYHFNCAHDLSFHYKQNAAGQEGCCIFTSREIIPVRRRMLLAAILTHVKIAPILSKSEIRLNSGSHHEYVATDDLAQMANVTSGRQEDAPPAIRIRSQTLSKVHTARISGDRPRCRPCRWHPRTR